MGTARYIERNTIIFLSQSDSPNFTLKTNLIRIPRLKPTEAEPVYTVNEMASCNAIVFRDSFSVPWYAFLARNFREVIYIWHRQWDRPLIERERPDVIIDEMTERFL